MPGAPVSFRAAELSHHSHILILANVRLHVVADDHHTDLM